jgi:hypothetical protein
MKKQTDTQRCWLQSVPKFIGLLAGWGLTGFGLILFITPLPGGLLMMLTGAMILCCKSPSLRAAILRRLAIFPGLHSRLKTLLNACDRCVQTRSRTT